MDSFTPATYIHYIAECCRKKDLVVIYKIDDPDYMLDEAILKAKPQTSIYQAQIYK